MEPIKNVFDFITQIGTGIAILLYPLLIFLVIQFMMGKNNDVNTVIQKNHEILEKLKNKDWTTLSLDEKRVVIDDEQLKLATDNEKRIYKIFDQDWNLSYDERMKSIAVRENEFDTAFYKNLYNIREN
jgi:hypothetical protein